MIKRLLRDRKGVSLTEVVVSMTIVLMITGAAISVMLASSKADAAFRKKYQALTACENAAECLRFSQGDEDDLKGALEKVGFDTTGTEYTYPAGDNNIVKVYYENNRYVVMYNAEIIYEYK